MVGCLRWCAKKFRYDQLPREVMPILIAHALTHFVFIVQQAMFMPFLRTLVVCDDYDITHPDHP